MKRIVALFIVLLMCLSMSGCYLTYRVLTQESGSSAHFEMSEELVNNRPNFQLGTCRDLRGDVEVHLFFMNDKMSSWTVGEQERYVAQQLTPALRFLEIQASNWDVDLSFSLHRYDTMEYPGVMEEDATKSLGGISLLSVVAECLGYEGEVEFMEALQGEEKKQVIPISVFNKRGLCYVNVAQASFADDSTLVHENLCMFTSPIGCNSSTEKGAQASGIVFHILRIFGAENMFTVANRENMAPHLYPDDVMYWKYGDFTQMEIGDFTAYCVGWTHGIPDVCYMPDWWE